MIKLGHHLSLDEVFDLVFCDAKAKLSDDASKKIAYNYKILSKLSKSDTAYYGINTGFGALAEKRISVNDSLKLQKNIILSHAVGVGEPLDFFCAKALTLLRLSTLAQGFSGASPNLINHLLVLLNNNCAPLVPKKGSVGASGDLAPLAHLGLLLLGIGDAFKDNKKISAQEVLSSVGLSKLALGVRDGLAIINGTQAMTATGIVAIKECRMLLNLADLNAAAVTDAILGHLSPFDSRVHELKPHPGQILSAKNIRKALLNRDLKAKNPRTQDPYSVRCSPQVHGTSRDVLSHVEDIIVRELNSVTDNPLIFIEENEAQILSGGNFHGQAIAMALDYLAMAIAELANISERRMEIILNPHHSNGLPPFLIDNPGINSGYMMLQVTAAALINENKVLTHPASTDSIPTSANREDHVSMGMTAANKLMQIICNTKTVLAIEMLMAHQALDHRSASVYGSGVKKVHQSLRETIAFRKEDGLYLLDLERALLWLNSSKKDQELKSILTE